MDNDMPAEKRQMLILGLGGATIAAAAFLIWMVAGYFQRDQLVQNALPSKPLAGFEKGGSPAKAPVGGGMLPGAPPTNTSLPGAPPMAR